MLWFLSSHLSMKRLRENVYERRTIPPSDELDDDDFFSLFESLGLAPVLSWLQDGKL